MTASERQADATRRSLMACRRRALLDSLYDTVTRQAEEILRLRAVETTARRVLEADLKYDWRILTNRAAEAFAELQRALGDA